MDDRTREQLISDALKPTYGPDTETTHFFKEAMKLEFIRLRKRMMGPSIMRQLIPPIPIEEPKSDK